MQLDEEQTIKNNECTNITLNWNNIKYVTVNKLYYVHTVGNTK